MIVHQSGLEVLLLQLQCLILSEGLDHSRYVRMLVTGERTGGNVPTVADVVGPITRVMVGFGLVLLFGENPQAVA